MSDIYGPPPSLEDLLARLQALPQTPGFAAFIDRRDECPNAPHRGPQGPNEDLGQCPLCWSVSWSLRPAGEEFGGHADDCSLPQRHEGYCVGGGTGHPPPVVMRG